MMASSGGPKGPLATYNRDKLPFIHFAHRSPTYQRFPLFRRSETSVTLVCMQVFAHSIQDQPESEWEPLAHHLSGVGRRAASFASEFGGAEMAGAMGLLHDIGKASQAYQLYIRKPRGDGGSRGPDHSSAGAIEAVKAYGQFGRLLAFGIAGHHGGLMDGAGHEPGSLSVRLSKAVENYGGWRAHTGALPPAEALASEARQIKANGIEPAFSIAFRARMLFSCLVDADFLETEAFYARSRREDLPSRGGTLRAEHRDIVRAHMARHRRDDTPVNQLRSTVLDHANGKARLSPGLFTLTVPTGGGKTLTSLSFAMEHALEHDLRRIVYVIPFTGAWIETPPARTSGFAQRVAPSRGRGSKLAEAGHPDRPEQSPLHGGVDRNTVPTELATSIDSRPFTGAWIET